MVTNNRRNIQSTTACNVQKFEETINVQQTYFKVEQIIAYFKCTDNDDTLKAFNWNGTGTAVARHNTQSTGSGIQSTKRKRKIDRRRMRFYLLIAQNATREILHNFVWFEFEFDCFVRVYCDVVLCVRVLTFCDCLCWNVLHRIENEAWITSSYFSNAFFSLVFIYSVFYHSFVCSVHFSLRTYFIMAACCRWSHCAHFECICFVLQLLFVYILFKIYLWKCKRF